MNQLTLSSCLILLAVTQSAAHADSIQNTSQAAGDSAEASARLVASGVQVTLGAAAIPLSAAGAVTAAGGSTAMHLADDLWTAANTPLKVDNDIAVAQPLPSLEPLSTTSARPQREAED